MLVGLLERANSQFWFTISFFISNNTVDQILNKEPRAQRPQLYCILGYKKITEVVTVSFRWIIHFWYVCLILGDKARLSLSSKRKQKYQNGNIHRKPKVPTSEREGKLSNPRTRAERTRCMEKIYGILRKPARARRAREMHWFSAGHRYRTRLQ